MIRSPQAFLISLLLHLIMGTALLYFVVPKMVHSQSSAVKRCRIMLSQIAPVLPQEEVQVEKHTIPKPRKAAADVKKSTVAPEPVVKKSTVAPEPTVDMPSEVKNETQTVEAVEAQADPVAKPVTFPEEQESARESAPPVSAEKDTPKQAVLQSPESYLQDHLAIIASLLKEYLYYPRMARKRHIEGEVLAVFTIERDGTVRDIAVKKHARAVLDHAAIRTIESLSGLFPHPKTPLTLEVPIRFVLK